MTTVTTKKKTTPADATAMLSVVSFGGKEVEQLPTPAYLLHEASPLLVAQAIHSGDARSRIRRAHTKGRSEVRGGGRKPWKQKGTGRSRHGSSRSPLWVGGGITFGPRSRKRVVIAVPDMLRKRALASALGSGISDGSVTIIRLPEVLPVKTKDMAAVLDRTDHGVLLIAAAINAGALSRAGRNIPGLVICSVADLTVNQVVWSQKIWIDEAALSQLEARCS